MAYFRFTARIRPFGPDGAFVEIPAHVADALGEGDRLAVVARVQGIAVRKALSRRAGGKYRMSVDRAIRAETGLGPGDEIEIELERDTA